MHVSSQHSIRPAVKATGWPDIWGSMVVANGREYDWQLALMGPQNSHGRVI